VNLNEWLDNPDRKGIPLPVADAIRAVLAEVEQLKDEVAWQEQRNAMNVKTLTAEVEWLRTLQKKESDIYRRNVEEVEVLKQLNHDVVQDEVHWRNKAGDRKIEEQTKEIERLEELAERRRQDRADALNVKSRDGLLSSEWLARTGKAERERDEARAEVERLRARINKALKAAPKDPDRAALCNLPGYIRAMVRALKGGEK